MMEFLYVIPDMLAQTTGQDSWALWPVIKQYVIGLVTLEAVCAASLQLCSLPLSPPVGPRPQPRPTVVDCGLLSMRRSGGDLRV